MRRKEKEGAYIFYFTVVKPVAHFCLLCLPAVFTFNVTVCVKRALCAEQFFFYFDGIGHVMGFTWYVIKIRLSSVNMYNCWKLIQKHISALSTKNGIVLWTMDQMDRIFVGFKSLKFRWKLINILWTNSTLNSKFSFMNNNIMKREFQQSYRKILAENLCIFFSLAKICTKIHLYT